MRKKRKRIAWVPSQIVLASVVVLVVAGVAVYGVRATRSCGVGVERLGPHKECIGVTDGTFIYSDDPTYASDPTYARDLKAVEEKIRKENELLSSVKNRQIVSIAVLRPMTPDPTDKSAKDTLVHGLEGAYIAQYLANHDPGGKITSHVPLIRLLLANSGRLGEQWRRVTRELKRLADGPERLMAVTGFYQSLDTTKQAIKQLADDGIPTVGTAITADDLTNAEGRYPGLVRIAPTNTDEATAAVRLHFAKPAMLVEDIRRGDPYVKTLSDVFKKLLGISGNQSLQFRSPLSTADEDLSANAFNQMAIQICQEKPEVIYFAGRTKQLKQFVNELGDRHCPERFTILTGDEGSRMDADPPQKSALASGITIQITALAHPGAWTTDPIPATGGSTKDYKAFADPFLANFRPSHLEDGLAIMEHDAVLTAVTAIRALVAQPNPIISRASVIDEWRLLRGPLAVRGASGTISLGNDGNPLNKAIPILQLKPDTTFEFKTVAWPNGVPPPE